MKQPKKLTRDHKKYLNRCNLNPDQWVLLSEDTEKYTYINKISGQTRVRMKNS